LSAEEPDNSLSMGDEHLDTIPAMELDKFIKSSVETLIPIPSESEEVMEIVIPELNGTLAKIKDQMTSITSLCEIACQVVQKKLEEKQIEEERAAKSKYWKLPVCYDDDDDEERSDSLDDNIISGLPSFSAITPDEPKPDQIEDFSESNKEFSSIDDDSFSIDDIDYVEASPPDSELVSSEVMEIVIPEVEPNSRDFIKDVVEDISPTKEPQVLTALPTHPTLQLNMKFQPSSESIFAYVVWIFLPFLVYSVVPYCLLSLRTEDIIFDPGICKSTFSRPDISHRCRTVKKFNTHRSHLNTCPMLIHEQNNTLLDVLLFHFYPP
nr:hypothetical protein [Tanacetum cinerariifolium]